MVTLRIVQSVAFCSAETLNRHTTAVIVCQNIINQNISTHCWLIGLHMTKEAAEEDMQYQEV